MSNQFFKLFFNDENEKAIVCKEYKLQGVKKFDVSKGRFIQEWPNDVTLYYESGEPEDYLGNALGWLVVSPLVQRILNEMGVENTQFLPISIKNVITEKKDLHGYAVLNILNVISALDKKHSTYEEDPEFPEYPIILKVALCRKSIQNTDIFRLKEQNCLVFISQRVKDELELVKVTGFKFTAVPVY